VLALSFCLHVPDLSSQACGTSVTTIIFLIRPLDAHHGVIAARAILTPINIRLKPQEVAYILEHSGAKLILVDYEYLHLIEKRNVPVIVSNDTGLAGDPYEDFLSSGRRFSQEKGWLGLDVEPDENAAATLCYT
jgi:long-subunit acyl-CoA synthetase (AMP-forming)